MRMETILHPKAHERDRARALVALDDIIINTLTLAYRVPVVPGYLTELFRIAGIATKLQCCV